MRTSDPDQRHDISSLTNLRSFRIWTDENNEDMEASLVVIRRYLSQLQKHSPLLEEISIVVCYENDASIEALSVLDNILGGKGFENLRLLQFEIHFPPYYELEDEDAESGWPPTRTGPSVRRASWADSADSPTVARKAPWNWLPNLPSSSNSRDDAQS